MRRISESFKKLITHWNPKSPISESFRTLRTNIQFMGVKKKMHSILVTSSQANEGKTFVSANLSIIMGQDHKKVIYIDGDLRNPSGHEIFNVENKIGLSNYLAEQVNLDEVIQPTPFQNVSVISAGLIPPNPAELLGSGKMEELLEELQKRYDKVVLDAPPILPVTDAVILSAMVDGCLLVFESGKTDRNLIKKAKQQLENVNAPILGLVMNNKKKNKEAFENGYYGKK